MRSFLYLFTTLLVMLGVLTQCSISQAHADTSTNEQQFINEVRAAGFDKPDNIALRDGYLSCAAILQTGGDEGLVERAISAAQRFLNHPVDPQLDAAFNTAAEKWLCPGASQ